MIDLSGWPLVARRSAAFEPLSPEAQERARAKFDEAISDIAPGITSSDVHVMGMRIVNSKRDFYFSRFSLDALNEVAELTPGRPVMAGHDYRSLPLGTFFASQRVRIDEAHTPRRDQYWVESLWFTPRDAEGDAIEKRVRMRVWREYSLGWMSLLDTCSLCSKSIRSMECPHIPGEVYSKGFCEYEMSGITQVLEGSIVFAGGQKGTHSFTPQRQHSESFVRMQAADMADHGSLGEFLVPHQIRELKCMQASKAPEHEIDSFLRGVREDNAAPLRNRIDAIVCMSERFATQKDASSWVREHSFLANNVREVDGGFEFRQNNRGEIGSERVRLDEGVQAVLHVPQASSLRVVPPVEDEESRIESTIESLFK